MTAGDCYRFCLSNPHVDLVLTGPKNRQQLQENVHHLREKGPLSEEEMHWIREFGQVVHKASSRVHFQVLAPHSARDVVKAKATCADWLSTPAAQCSVD